jgi:hypothetical protein
MTIVTGSDVAAAQITIGSEPEVEVEALGIDLEVIREGQASLGVWVYDDGEVA